MDYTITHDPDSEVRTAVASGSGRTVMVLPDGKSRLFKRRAIKRHPSGETEESCWLVAELDGVRTYVEGDQIVVTRQELYP